MEIVRYDTVHCIKKKNLYFVTDGPVRFINGTLCTSPLGQGFPNMTLMGNLQLQIPYLCLVYESTLLYTGASRVHMAPLVPLFTMISLNNTPALICSKLHMKNL